MQNVYNIVVAHQSQKVKKKVKASSIAAIENKFGSSLAKVEAAERTPKDERSLLALGELLHDAGDKADHAGLKFISEPIRDASNLANQGSKIKIEKVKELVDKVNQEVKAMIKSQDNVYKLLSKLNS